MNHFSKVLTQNLTSSQQMDSNIDSGDFDEHIVLLGDSILDNHQYVQQDHPAVIDQLQKKINLLQLNWKATNCAVDGARTIDLINNYIETLPQDTTYIILSIGGNDGLKSLRQLVFDSSNWLPWRLYKIFMSTQEKFRLIYKQALEKIKLKCPNAKIIVCTIYYPYFPHNVIIQCIANIGINLLSNVIIDSALKYGNIPIIDLRYIFDKKQDYANSIEPGVPGGDKLINNAMNIIQTHNFDIDYKQDVNSIIYKDAIYSDDVTPSDYNGKYWKMQNVKEQQGSAATIFFRRAFDERENKNIKFYTKLSVIAAVSSVIGVLVWKLGRNKS